jgi:serine phosphatase RsbU (regulator of sigma subunit)
MRKNLLITFFIALLPAQSLLANAGDTLFVSADILATGRLNLGENITWKYHPGDDTTWAFPDFDDDDWDTVSSWMWMSDFDIKKWTGIGWFRKIIKIDSALMNSSVGIFVHHEGASEIFLNGKRIFKFGKVNENSAVEEICDPGYAPYVINLDSNMVYTLAVRYSNHQAFEMGHIYEKFFNHIGFSIELFNFNANVESELESYYNKIALGWGLNGFTLAFSIIFFLLYLFYSKRKINLYFALFVFGISLFGITVNLQLMGPAALELIAFYRFLQFGGVSLTFIFFLLFIYRIVYQRVIKLFRVFLLAFIFINLFSFFGSEGIFSYMMPLGIVIGIMSIESVRVIIVGIIRKVEYIWIVAAGVFIFMFLTVQTMMLPALPVNNIISDMLFVLHIVSLPVSMAIYLAKSYAKVNNDIEKQIITVKELSAKQIEQERQNAELQLNAELERKVNERKTEELEQARQLQLSMLPKEIPCLPNLDIAVYMKTATEVGGDYYDFYKSEDNKLNIVIGDATGHGINAGMMVSITKGLFQNLAPSTNLEEVFNRFNYSLQSMKLQPMYMTLRILRIKKSHLEVIGAGMYPFLIFEKATGVVREVESIGPPLGAFPNFNYTNNEFELSTGDVIVLMTDGFTERLNERKEMLGDEKAKAILSEVAGASTNEIIERFVKECDDWGGDRPQDDDVTFVVIKIK